MIKTAIKHFIYELCINQLFNGIQKNFNQPKVYQFTVGEHWDNFFVEQDDGCYHYFDCNVICKSEHSMKIAYSQSIYYGYDKSKNTIESGEQAFVLHQVIGTTEIEYDSIMDLLK